MIFVYDVRQRSNIILLHVNIQFSHHHLLKRLFFLHWMVSAPLSKIIWLYKWGFISGLCILFLVYFACLHSVPHCFNFCSFVMCFQIRKCEFYKFALLLPNCFGYLGSLEIPYEFLGEFFYFESIFSKQDIPRNMLISSKF